MALSSRVTGYGSRITDYGRMTTYLVRRTIRYSFWVNLCILGILLICSSKTPQKHALSKQESSQSTTPPQGGRLTDVIVPFVESQLENVQDFLEFWAEYPPCYAPTDPPFVINYFSFLSPPVGHDVTLTFSLAGMRNESIATRLLDHFNGLPQVVKRCFKEVKVHYCELRGQENGYFAGSQNMFEQMIKGEVGSNNPEVIYLMEPDVIPVRKYWLSALDASTRTTVEPFWIKGCIYRGRRTDVWGRAPNALHINGNALYNLKDEGFLNFYFEEVAPTISRHPRHRGYDVDFFLYMVDEKMYKRASSVAHYFQYTDLIWNSWKTNYTTSRMRDDNPNLFLVHGGTRRE